MSKLTKEEVDELASALVLINNEEPISLEDAAELRFNSAMEYVRKNPKFMQMSFEEIFKWFYMLGVNTDTTKEMSMQDFIDFLENERFIRMMEKAVKNPESLPKSVIVDVDDPGNVVQLTAECVGYQCSCSPQREDHCMSEEPTKCVITVPMKQLNQMINVK